MKIFNAGLIFMDKSVKIIIYRQHGEGNELFRNKKLFKR